MSIIVMIGQFLGGISFKTWRYLAYIVLAWLAVSWHGRAIESAKAEAVNAEVTRLQIEAGKVAAQAEADRLAIQTRAAMAELENQIAQMQRAKTLEVDLAHAVHERDGLLNTIAALRRGDNKASPNSSPITLTDAAPALADSLSECSDRYAEVAGVADSLTNQVTGLQEYIERVVLPALGSAE